MIILLKGNYLRAQFVFCFFRPASLIPSRTFSTWTPQGPKFLHVKPTGKVVPPSRIFLPPCKQSLKKQVNSKSILIGTVMSLVLKRFFFPVMSSPDIRPSRLKAFLHRLTKMYKPRKFTEVYGRLKLLSMNLYDECYVFSPSKRKVLILEVK